MSNLGERMDSLGSFGAIAATFALEVSVSVAHPGHRISGQGELAGVSQMDEQDHSRASGHSALLTSPARV